MGGAGRFGRAASGLAAGAFAAKTLQGEYVADDQILGTIRYRHESNGDQRPGWSRRSRRRHGVPVGSQIRGVVDANHVGLRQDGVEADGQPELESVFCADGFPDRGPYGELEPAGADVARRSLAGETRADGVALVD